MPFNPIMPSVVTDIAVLLSIVISPNALLFIALLLDRFKSPALVIIEVPVPALNAENVPDSKVVLSAELVAICPPAVRS